MTLFININTYLLIIGCSEEFEKIDLKDMDMENIREEDDTNNNQARDEEDTDSTYPDLDIDRDRDFALSEDTE